MSTQVVKADSAMSQLFDAEVSSAHAQARAFELSMALVALSAEADKRQCLPEVMAQEDVRRGIRRFLEQHLSTVLLSGGPANEASKLNESYVDMLAWQFSLLDLASPALD